jgi:hypothetical protein
MAYLDHPFTSSLSPSLYLPLPISVFLFSDICLTVLCLCPSSSFTQLPKETEAYEVDEDGFRIIPEQQGGKESNKPVACPSLLVCISSACPLISPPTPHFLICFYDIYFHYYFWVSFSSSFSLHLSTITCMSRWRRFFLRESIWVITQGGERLF